MAEEECLLQLNYIYEQCLLTLVNNETHKKQIKFYYDKSTRPHVFFEGDPFLVYDQGHAKLGAVNLNPCGMVPTFLNMFSKRAYELFYYEGNPLSEP